MAARGHADAQRLVAALSAHANGRQYLNFAENPVDSRTGYRDEAWVQLKGIRSAVDPDGLFVANHRIPRLWEDGRPAD
jgi:FAD/FMN-containing dehydrogenase